MRTTPASLARPERGSHTAPNVSESGKSRGRRTCSSPRAGLPSAAGQREGLSRRNAGANATDDRFVAEALARYASAATECDREQSQADVPDWAIGGACHAAAAARHGRLPCPNSPLGLGNNLSAQTTGRSGSPAAVNKCAAPFVRPSSGCRGGEPWPSSNSSAKRSLTLQGHE